MAARREEHEPATEEVDILPCPAEEGQLCEQGSTIDRWHCAHCGRSGGEEDYKRHSRELAAKQDGAAPLRYNSERDEAIVRAAELVLDSIAAGKEWGADEQTERTTRPAASGSCGEVHVPRMDARVKPQSREQPTPLEIGGSDPQRAADAEAEQLLQAEERLSKRRAELARQRAAGSAMPIPKARQHRQEAGLTQETEGTERASLQVRREGGSSSVSSVSSVKEEREAGEAQDLRRLRSLLKRAAERSAVEVRRYQDSSLQKDFRSAAFMFARGVKSLPEFKGLDAEAATARIDAVLDSMYPDSPAPWVELGLPDLDSRGKSADPRSDFLAVWDSITTAFDVLTPVDLAAQHAAAEPVYLGQEFSRPADSTFRQVVSVCYWLGKEHREGEFFVSYRDLARSLHIGSHVTAGQLLKRAEKTGFLVSLPYSEEDRRNRRAMRWRFIFSRIPPRA